MLMLFRKPGQGIEIKNKHTGKLCDFDFLYNENGLSHYRVNGQSSSMGQDEPFYLDEEKSVMVIIMHSDSSVRVGIDAPMEWIIRRKEVEFD